MRHPSAEEILGKPDLPHEDVAVPEWGDDVVVRVRTMTAAERDQWESEVLSSNGKDLKVRHENYRARLVAACAVSENGDRLFATPEHLAALGGKSSKALDRLADAAQKLNRLSAADVEELVGNSDAARSGDSSSRSRRSSA